MTVGVCQHADVRYCENERGAVACFDCGRLFGHLRPDAMFVPHNPPAQREMERLRKDRGRERHRRRLAAEAHQEAIALAERYRDEMDRYRIALERILDHEVGGFAADVARRALDDD